MLRSIALCSTLIFSLLGCESTYYAAMEKVGVHKRDIMVDRVEEARDAQEDAQEQFKSALEQFQALTNFDGGDLQRMYEATSDSYESSAESAQDVTQRIDAVEDVAGALFDEWEDEIDQISSDRLKRDSRNKLKATQRNYQDLIRSMRKAEAKMEPVLVALKDNMLYLKHNLNAAAIGSLEQEYRVIKSDIDVLISEMNASIATSNEFIESLRGT
ncbi:DUF2959 domain-containing protein [Echinimonas agarilytica]|uniref:DUF2959 domain-containing protein n=1 Tax=Echinimonas agarilytica TaxID=1215918 RepID=A0AA41W884_9GAMM|nr:DUF2959 domain-containing protein [Echinimonas agarilytica]MCM2681015.1 DUF2959 domain-containing protein [Echinimonas agarilytica]